MRATACTLLYNIRTAWATVLLFVTKGNTRASVSGTARLQSRFLFVYMFAGKNMIFDILDYRNFSQKRPKMIQKTAFLLRMSEKSCIFAANFNRVLYAREKFIA